jgi:hypothetical protein
MDMDLREWVEQGMQHPGQSDTPPPNMEALRQASRLAARASEQLERGDWGAVGSDVARVLLALALALLQSVGPVALEVASTKINEKLRAL